VTQKSEDVHVKWLELELKILYQIMEGGFLACSLHAGATMTAGYEKLNLPFSHTTSFRRNSNPTSEVRKPLCHSTNYKRQRSDYLILVLFFVKNW
jgi:hypothetical protein